MITDLLRFKTRKNRHDSPLSLSYSAMICLALLRFQGARLSERLSLHIPQTTYGSFQVSGRKLKGSDIARPTMALPYGWMRLQALVLGSDPSGDGKPSPSGRKPYKTSLRRYPVSMDPVFKRLPLLPRVANPCVYAGFRGLKQWS